MAATTALFSLSFSCDGVADEDVDVFLNLTPLKVAGMMTVCLQV
jgi:hypothetical protein